MTLELNKPYFVKRVANKSGTLHYLPMEGLCNGVELNKPMLAKRVADKDGTLHFLLSDQKLEPDGKLKLNKPYFAKRVSNKDGVLHYLVSGKKCGGGDVPFCDCPICCTLHGTVQLPAIGSPATWSDPIDIELTCGSSYTLTNGESSCLNDEIEDDTIIISHGTTTYSPKSGIVLRNDPGYGDIPTAFNTDIWKSQEFTYNSNTYRVVFVATEFEYLEGSLRKFCKCSMMLQGLSDIGWCTLILMTGNPNGYALGAPDADVIETVIDPGDDGCPPGYSPNGGENQCSTLYPGYFTYPTQDEEAVPFCPIFYEGVAEIDIPPTKYVKIQLFDLCDEEE